MQKKLFLMAALLLGTICPTFTSADVTSCDNSRHSIGNHLPALRLRSTFSPFNDNSAVAIISEIGLRDLRFNGTYGMGFGNNLRAKVTGEYLMQKLDYGFSTGKARRWMRQMAIGGDAQYLLCNCFVNDLHVRGFYSYAPSHRLHTLACPVIPGAAIVNVVRRIAGSHAYGFLAGTSITPWSCGYLGLNVNYDHVAYNRKFNSRKVTAGLGGGIEFRQVLTQTVSFNVKGEIRKPFNYIGGGVDWNKAFCSGLFSAGVFANYTRGKKNLPNVTVLGISLGFNFAARNLYNYNDCCEPVCCTYDSCDLIAYVQEPAIFLPVVLAISEESTCNGPSLADGAIPNAVVPLGSIQYVDLNSHFANGNGGTITYEAVVAAVATTPNNPAFYPAFNAVSGIQIQLNNNGTMTLNNTRTNPHFPGVPPPTGLVGIGVTYNVTVVASTQCGSITRSFLVTMPGI